jgi:catechol 2,3-dioxygenase-like lactoylglutathione lyase family enzyme
VLLLCESPILGPENDRGGVQVTVPARITIVTLGVADLERAAGFYDRLGWRRSSASTADIVWFVTAGTVLGLSLYEELAADAKMPAARRGGFCGITLAINVADGGGVQPVLDAAEAAGGAILKQATQMEWGGVSGYFADVDDYPWEVVWSPSFPMDERGLLEIP